MPTAKPPFLLTPEDVLKAEKPHSLWLLEPFIPIGGVTFLFGRWSTFKTPIAMAMARAIAEGRDLWGLTVPKARPVLFLEVDMAQIPAQERMKPMLEGVPVGTPLDVWFDYPGFDVTKLDKDTAEKLAELKAWHAQQPYAAVFVDALKGITGGDINDSQTAKDTYAFFHRIFPGATIVFVHHSKKVRRLPGGGHEGNQEESFSGSQAWANHATVSLHTIRPDSRSPAIVLRHYKSQLSDLHADISLKVRDGHRFTQAIPLSYNALCEALEALPPEFSKGERERALAELFGVSPRTIRRKLAEGEEGDEEAP